MEEWRPLRETNLYEASSEGYIRNVNTGKILTGTIDAEGRLKVLLTINGIKYSRNVKRLVAEAFWGDACDGYVIFQRDGDLLNTRLDNLVIGTLKDSIANAYRTGKRKGAYH